MMGVEPRMEHTTVEAWMSAYTQAKKLNIQLFDKMIQIYGEDGSIMHHEYFVKLSRFFKEHGETDQSLQNVAVYHAFNGSTIFPEQFKPGESRVDLPGNNSIIRIMQARLTELEKMSLDMGVKQ